MTDKELTLLIQDLSCRYFSKPFRHEATFNKRLKTTGGRYMLKSHNIEVNPKSYEKYGYTELEGIIKHELCHYHLHIEGKGYKHRDSDFKNLLKETGSPRFCQMPLQETKQKVAKRYTYSCINCSTRYTRKIRMNTERYRCGKCSGRLKMV